MATVVATSKVEAFIGKSKVDCVGVLLPWHSCNCKLFTQTSMYNIHVSGDTRKRDCLDTMMAACIKQGSSSPSDNFSPPPPPPAQPPAPPPKLAAPPPPPPPVNCIGAIGNCGVCSKTCGIGKQAAAYQVYQAAANGGVTCTSKAGDTKTQPCRTRNCPVNCIGYRGGRGGCSTTCGAGKQIASYKWRRRPRTVVPPVRPTTAAQRARPATSRPAGRRAPPSVAPRGPARAVLGPARACAMLGQAAAPASLPRAAARRRAPPGPPVEQQQRRQQQRHAAAASRPQRLCDATRSRLAVLEQAAAAAAERLLALLLAAAGHVGSWCAVLHAVQC